MDLIVTDDLKKNYGEVRALDGLNLKVPKGVFGLIGVNGAGKTTTIKILVGALRPDGGRAHVLGLDCVKESLRIRQKVGVLHEKPAFPKNLSGLNYLIFVAQLYGLPKKGAEKQSWRVIEEMGLSSVLKRPIGGYSAGMKQRLGLAQALLSDPELVMLDEPTANLDPIGRGELLEKIRKLNAEKGVSFLISSHILPELQTVCDHVGIINNGVIVEQGEVSEVIGKYAGNFYKVIVSDPKIFLETIHQSGLVEEAYRVGDTIYIRSKEAMRLQDYVMEVIHRKKLHLLSFQCGDLERALKSILEANKND